jgi:hypothetical protein
VFVHKNIRFNAKKKERGRGSVKNVSTGAKLECLFIKMYTSIQGREGEITWEKVVEKNICSCNKLECLSIKIFSPMQGRE